MNVLSLIRRKRRGQELSPADIEALVRGVVDGGVPDYQLSALLMVICYEGLTYAETVALTRAFVESGATLDWSDLRGPVVDKHSTGGVGDKASLLLLPWLAAVGLTVPKMSGRGLGHTGGTIDKLESIPGFNVNLSRDEMRRVLSEVGCVVVAQSADLVPADKRIYALRDATDTVDELGLIAASVLSKKLAAGAECIVLDVKCGSGAFFTDEQRAREFAQLALRLGREFGRDVSCVISNMDQPLGEAVGNALEVAEVLAVLEGQSSQPDLVELCATLGGVLLARTGRCDYYGDGKALMYEALVSRAVLERFRRWVYAQGGDLGHFRRSQAQAGAVESIEVPAPRSGVICRMDARAIGEVARSLGAGRQAAEDSIDPRAGVRCLLKVGERVAAGDPLAVMARGKAGEQPLADLVPAYQNAVTIEDQEPEVRPLVLDVLLSTRGLNLVGG